MSADATGPNSFAPGPSPALDLTDAELLELYRGMIRARAAEERLELLHRQGKVGGGVYRSLGQEAVGVGAAFALRRRTDGTGDVLAQTIRTAGAVFLFGGEPVDFFRQYLARGTGPTEGKEANVHWTDWEKGMLGPVSPLGTMLQVIAGVTLACRMKGEDRIGVCFPGDGESSTGAWHEGLHFAASQRCPMVVVLQANRWAFSTPTWKQTRVRSFADKAAGYGIRGESVDGNDVLAVYEAVRQAARHARDGKGPTLIEARTYRRKGHAQHDPQDYVDPAELEEWAERDPVDRFRKQLIDGRRLDVQALDRIVEEASEEMAEAAARAVDEPMPDPEIALREVYTGVDAERPWTRREPAVPAFESGPVERT